MALMSRSELWLWTFVVALVVLLSVLVARADAHTPAELDAWMQDWTERVNYSPSPRLLDELSDMQRRHPCWVEGCKEPPLVERGGSRTRLTSTRNASTPLAPAAIRALVEAYFLPQYVDDALSVAWCESRFDPDAANPRSSARGLFQHLVRYWPERSVRAGWAGASILDPEANVAVAAWLSQGGSSWSHWVCKPG